MAALMAATAFITIGCQNDTESRIAGIYEHPALPGQTFEFHADHTFMNTTGAGTMDCIIKTSRNLESRRRQPDYRQRHSKHDLRIRRQHNGGKQDLSKRIVRTHGPKTTRENGV